MRIYHSLSGLVFRCSKVLLQAPLPLTAFFREPKVVLLCQCSTKPSMAAHLQSTERFFYSFLKVFMVALHNTLVTWLLGMSSQEPLNPPTGTCWRYRPFGIKVIRRPSPIMALIFGTPFVMACCGRFWHI